MVPMWLLVALASLSAVRALSSWYTEPSGIPAGSVSGDKIRGVDLGGWFILENWMMPDLFAVSPLDQQIVPDEWTYCSVLGKEECVSRLTTHWDSYVTEDDFKRFANYSINTIRIPIGFWAWTDGEDYEPFIQGQLPYLERALYWSDNYGIDVLLDLHGLPGGQNGQDNSGRMGPIEFQANSTNLNRALTALANMTSTATADQFNGVVKAIELTNEPYILQYAPNGMDFNTLANFYVQGYATVRASENIMSGNHEVMVVIHDAFQPLLSWEYFWSEPSLGLNWTNYALDTHIYDAFGGSSDKTDQEHLDTICALASGMSAAQAKYPIIVGEFSLGTNTYCVDYQSCFGASLSDTIANLTNNEASLFLRQFWEVQVDVYELAAGWIFWSHANQFGAPWSWSQSAAQNWIPEDPTERIWPFYSNASSYCLDTANPLAGDQNIPSFPGYANNISNIDIAFVKPKNGTTTASPSMTTASPFITPMSPTSSKTASITVASPTTSIPTASAKSGGDQRTIPISLLTAAILGVSIVLAISG